MPEQFTVLIPDVLDRADIEEEVFGDAYRVLVPRALRPDEIPAETWAETDAVLAFHELYGTASATTMLTSRPRVASESWSATSPITVRIQSPIMRWVVCSLSPAG
jgi:hypothetical protein